MATEIKVRFSSYDGGGKTRKFKTLKGARDFAHKMVGPHPEISTLGYAVGAYGDAKITVTGATLKELFPEPEETGPVAGEELSDHYLRSL